MISQSSQTTRKTLRRPLNTSQRFYTKGGMEVGIDATEKSKTTIMTNDKDFPRELRVHLGNKTIEIPVMEQGKSYKYLGIHINTELNWNYQQKKKTTNAKIMRYSGYLRSSCLKQ